jgi:translation initiation factor 2 subunit 1
MGDEEGKADYRMKLADDIAESQMANCRMYENKYPEVDDLVTVQVKSIAEMGAYVSLLEYHNIEGMILLSELSRRRIRSINKLIRVGRQEIVVVLRVDKDKGYIDLSKRRVSPEDVARTEEKFNKSKAVHSIMRHVSETCGADVEQLYTQFGWPLYKKYGHAYEAFKRCVASDAEADALVSEYGLSAEIKDALVKNIRRRLTPQPVKMRADVEVTCFSYEGVDAVRESLLAAQKVGNEETPVKIKLVAPPLYVMTTTVLEKEMGVELLNKAIEVAKEEITKRKGAILVKVTPRITSDREDRMLANMISDMDAENQGDGDKDDDDDDDEDDEDDEE